MQDLEPAVLDTGLAMAMAWGEHFLQPIEPRLRAAYPAIADAQLGRYAEACREAMNAGHTKVGELLAAMGELAGDALFERFAAEMLARWPWISRDNLGHLYSQGCYYAMK